jgi:hypothetical protein
LTQFRPSTLLALLATIMTTTPSLRRVNQTLPSGGSRVHNGASSHSGRGASGAGAPAPAAPAHAAPTPRSKSHVHDVAYGGPAHGHPAHGYPPPSTVSLVESLMRESADGIDVSGRLPDLKRAILTDGISADEMGMVRRMVFSHYVWLLLRLLFHAPSRR